MGRKTKPKMGVSDLAAAWRAGWSPADVNAILDRFEAMGDPNDPLPANEDDQDEIPPNNNNGVPDQDEDLDALFEDDTNDEDEEDEKDTTVESANDNLKKLEGLAIDTALSIENDRLKKEVARLQAANRRKDLSGGENTKSPEDALIDTFQSLFS